MKDFNNDICILVREMKCEYNKHLLSKESSEIIKNHLEHCEDCKNEFALDKDNSEENNRMIHISKRLRKRKIKNLLLSIVIVLTLFSVYQICIDDFEFTGGMAPEISNGEHIYAFKLAYTFSKPKRGDIVAYVFPFRYEFLDVSRIVALPDDTVEIKNDNLYINGELVEGYEGIKAWEGSQYYKDGVYSVKVPENCYYLIGDNLNNSYDSRFDDFRVYEDDIRGKVIFHVSKSNLFTRKNKVNSKTEAVSE